MKDFSPTDTPDSSPLKSHFAIKVIGVGGAGGNAVNHLARESLDGVEFSVMNTDAAALQQSKVDSRMILGSKSFRGLGAGGDPERGQQSAREDLDKITNLCAGADIVFVVAGLGGGTGTGASPVVAQAAKDQGALVLSIVVTPFDCEGIRRQRQALGGLKALKNASDGVICLPNQKVFKLIDEHTSLVEAFEITNNFVAQGVRGIWRLLSRPGLINVDFADLCSVTQGKHSESALVSVEAKGDHRVREVSERLLDHPLMENGQSLARASGLLVCIAGGPELSMKEVERIMEQIQRHSEQAHIIMGTAIDESLSGKICVTLVASCGEDLDVPSPTPESTPTPANAKAPALMESQETEDADWEEELLSPETPARATTRFTPPAPQLSPEKTQQLFRQQSGRNPFKSKGANRMRQGQLPLDIISKGRFEKSEPTLYRGEDLDVPTYIRRGVPLN
jgi:cell division protein FtsZ